VSLRADGASAVLSIEDDGRGFAAGDRAATGHFGLANLRDRAAGIGGTTSIESTPGQGTRIIVRLPMLDAPTDPPIDRP
jgi:NarL family two-component system sensor histidine kinase LiaS